MANSADRIFQQQKKSLAEQLWLHYFNAILYEKGLITESQRNRIYNMIDTRNMGTDHNKKKYRG